LSENKGRSILPFDWKIAETNFSGTLGMDLILNSQAADKSSVQVPNFDLKMD
jgi:hypothetical protein